MDEVIAEASSLAQAPGGPSAVTQPSLQLDHPPRGPGSPSTGESIPPSRPQFPSCESRPHRDPPAPDTSPGPSVGPAFLWNEAWALSPDPRLQCTPCSLQPLQARPFPALLPTPFTCRSRQWR